MNVMYCEKWIRTMKRPLNVLDSIAALARHKSRQYYSALLGPPGKPTHVIFLSGAWVKVGFLDDERREFLNYDFKETEQGKLFLTSATHREFRVDSAEVSRSKLFRFQFDGRILIEDHDLIGETIVKKRTTFDPSMNWETYPQFGDYVALCKQERFNPS